MKRLFRETLCLFLIAADWLAISASRKKIGIALVRLDAIGDFVLWTHSAHEYRDQYRSEKLVLIANALWADLAAQLPYWDEVWPVEAEKFNKDLLYRWRTMRRISNAGFRVAIQPTYSRVMLKGDSVMRATGAPHKIGNRGDTSNITKLRKVIADKWFTQLVPSSMHPLSEPERNVEFFNLLFNVSFPLQLRTFPVLTVSFGAWHNKVQHEYMILFPGASKTLRQWPARQFARVADELHRQYGWQILLCGSAGEWELCQSVCEHMKAESYNLAGKTTLPEFVELARGARLLVGNETSAIHIAVAVNTPTVCITGGGHYGRFVPYPFSFKSPVLMVANHRMACYSCNWQCILPYQQDGPVPCIEKITTKDVLHLVAKLQERAMEEN